MAYKAKVMVSGAAQLTASAATYYTCPANTAAVVQSATLCNTTANARTATIYRVPTGGTASATNAIASAVPIGPGESYNCPELIGKVLTAGDTIQALADSATAVSFQVGGVEIPQ